MLDHAYVIHGVRHPFHNRQEITAYLERRKEVRPGWERYLPGRLPA